MNGPVDRLLGKDGVAAPLSYEEAKELARHADASVRSALATREDLKPELLYFLAEDQAPEVRRAIARNATAPHQADAVLARDADEDVRTGLAAKIAKVAPGLSADEQDRVRQSAYQALDLLARDQVTRVRQILSETLKDVADAPPEVIKRLAQDAELVVAGPVLEFSPVLTDDDLREIIESGPPAGGLGAISRRSQVRESVADAIAATSDVEAIADLLSNPSAQIREETLDDLVDRASDVELWHAPLVKRPRLSSRAATRLAQFVADNLLDTLQEREDLDAKTLEAVKTMVHHRIGGGAGGDAATRRRGAQAGASEVASVDPPITVARRLLDAGRLDFKVISKALNASDTAFVVAALIVRSGLSQEVVARVFDAQSPKGIVALAWKANLPMSLAEQLQQRLGRIAPNDVLEAKVGDQFPMTDDEMTWQLEFFGDRSDKQGG